ncbi:hypothetical protein QEG98_11040 [Myxococcus sp. MxC21-1]|nr:hypothetical protein QEG98_11040 [Myxococcus sp. MxC21-1]
MRLFKAILLLMLVVGVVPTLMVGWLSVSHTRELLVRDAQELAQERVKQLRLKAEIFLGEPTDAVLGLARVPGFFGLPLEAQQTHLASVLNQRRDVLALTVFDANRQRLPGLQAFSKHDVPPTALAGHEERARALLENIEGVRYADVVKGPQGSEPVLTLAFPWASPSEGTSRRTCPWPTCGRCWSRSAWAAPASPIWRTGTGTSWRAVAASPAWARTWRSAARWRTC